VFPVLGLTRTGDCLGDYESERDNDVWALFFHSLQIPGYDETSPNLAAELLGSWWDIGSRVGLNLSFSNYGRFTTTSGYRPDSGDIQVWNGGGSYTVQGDRLHTMDPHGSQSERDVTRFFSIVRVPNPSKPSGYDNVLLMLEGSSDGNAVSGFSNSGNYVSRYVKDAEPGQ
jgi:hypothetical protein